MCSAAQAPTYASRRQPQQSLGRAVEARAHARRRRSFGVFEMGMNHAGEIRALTRLVRPHVALITTVAPAHLEFFPSVEAIADAKGEIFRGRGAGRRRRSSTATTRIYDADARPCRALPASGDRHLRRATPRPTGGCVDCRLQPSSARSSRRDPRRRCAYRSVRRASTWRINSLAVLAVAEALGADVAQAAARWPICAPPAGRGERRPIAVGRRPCAADRRELQRQPGLDARGAGAARPGQPGRRTAHRRARRHAGAGRRRRADLHAGSPTRSSAAEIDLVFTCGPMHGAPARCAAAQRAAAAMRPTLAALAADRARRRCGRATSCWSRARSAAAWPAWSTALARSARPQRRERALRTARRCSTACSSRSRDQFSAFNVFRYITFRTGGAVDDGAAGQLPDRASADLAGCKTKQREGQPIRARRAREPSADQEGHADHGRRPDPARR